MAKDEPHLLHGRLDPATATALAEALDPVDELFARFARVVGDPRPGSLHELDCRHPLGRYVHELAHAALGASVDHMLGWQAMLHWAHPVYSHMTVLRGALETACLGRWLVDPAATSVERITRGVAAQIEDFDQRRKFEVAAAIDKNPRRAPARSGAQRRSDVEARRNANGIAARRVPAATELCRDYAAPGLGGEVVYRMTSAFAHGKQWNALLAAVDDIGAERLPTGAVPMRIGANEEISVFVTRQVVATVIAAVGDAEVYAGGR